MPNYFTITKNPIARAGIIRKLLAKGYSLPEPYTVSDYFSKWPAQYWPVVIVRFDGEFRNKPTIDLMPSAYGIPSGSVQVSPNEISAIPQITSPDKSLVFPPAAKYNITYTKADGTMGNYMISNPIEANNDSITAYAFGRGVRTFVKSRVRSFSRVN